MGFRLRIFLLFLAELAHAFNYTVEQLFDERWGQSGAAGDQLDAAAWNNADQQKKVGLAPSILKGRGMVHDFRIRTSGQRNYNTDGRRAGVYVYLRQLVNGEIGQWRESTFLYPDDIPYYPDADPRWPESTINFVGGVLHTKSEPSIDPNGVDIMKGRDGVRLEYNKHAVTGNPETQNALMLSVFGLTYSGVDANSYSATGAAYVFTGEYYHWTQTTKLKIPVPVDDDDYHFARCLNIDKQTQDTAAISCAGCDPGKFKTAKVTAASDTHGYEGRGSVFIYKGNHDFKKWTATQMLWPRHNRWYYFGSAFLEIDGNTLVTDACKGAFCAANTFVQREYDSPMTDIFVYVKQESTGLWSEQQVLTDTVMETEVSSKSFNFVALHDDTIAYGNTLSVVARTAKIEGTGKYIGQVLIWYPNKPNYVITETFRYKADIHSRDESNSPRLNQHQWSFQQIITSGEVVMKGNSDPDAGSSPYTGSSFRHYFGKYISISGDRMAIGMRGKLSTTDDDAAGFNPVTILYTRPRQGGFWSQQQVLVNTLEKMGESSGITLYNTYFTVTGVKQYTKYMSETHGVWKCLIVTMFDEFGDGWDTAKLRVDAPDGTYDYFYPTCDAPTTADYDNHPNPFVFEYCPSMKEQGGMYKFYIVNGKEAKFNWEIEWKVELEVLWQSGSSGRFGSTNITGDIDTRLEFYWNPMTLSFEVGPTHNVVSNTASCHTCPVRNAHRMLSMEAEDETEQETEDGSDMISSRSLRHAARTASPTVSPAPTLLQDDHRLTDWENLVMSTSNPVYPWFSADRTGTYFFLSDLEGKHLLRKETQCTATFSALNRSCWLNYPDPIPDGDYVARIGGARAGQSTGLHMWSFCGIQGGQGEHLQFRVLHGSCYPVQRFTTSRYCTFKQGSTVVAVIVVSTAEINLRAITSTQKNRMFQVLTEILPNTKKEDYSITVSGQGSSQQATVHVTLRPSDHGLDPADFDAISILESTFTNYVQEAMAGGALDKELSASLVGDGSGSNDASGEVSVGMVTFDTATIASRPRGMVEDDDVSSRHQPVEQLDRDWLVTYTPASKWDKTVIAGMAWTLDIVSVLGYIGLAVCAVYGAKQVRKKYLQAQPTLQSAVDSTSTSLFEAQQAAAVSSGGLVSRVHQSLDSFSDNVYAMMNEAVKKPDEDEKLAIPKVVLPDMKTMFQDNRTKKSKKKSKKVSIEKNVTPSADSQTRGDSAQGNYNFSDYNVSDEEMSLADSTRTGGTLSSSEGSSVSASSSSGSSSSGSSSESSESSSSSSEDDEEIDLKELIRQGKSPYPSFKAPKAYSLY